MARYYFDTLDNGDFIQDDIGIELADMKAVKEQAAISLAELAHDVLPGSTRREMSVEARDEGQVVLRAYLNFEAVTLAS